MDGHVRIKSQNIFYSQQDEQRRQISEKGGKNRIMCETEVRHSVRHCGKVEFVDEVTSDEQKLFGGLQFLLSRCCRTDGTALCTAEKIMT